MNHGVPLERLLPLLSNRKKIVHSVRRQSRPRRSSGDPARALKKVPPVTKVLMTDFRRRFRIGAFRCNVCSLFAKSTHGMDCMYLGGPFCLGPFHLARITVHPLTGGGWVGTGKKINVE